MIQIQPLKILKQEISQAYFLKKLFNISLHPNGLESKY